MLTGLGARHDVEGVVQLAVAGAREPVPHDVAARDLDGGDAAVRGETGGGGEAADVADAAQDLGRHDRADAEQRGQRRLRGRDGLGDPSIQGRDVRVEPAGFSDEVTGQEAPGALRTRRRPTAAQERRRLVDRQGRGYGAWEQLGQQRMQPIDDLGSPSDHVIAPVREQAQRGGMVLEDGVVLLGRTACGECRADRVGLVGLAPVTGRQEPDAGGELRRDVDHSLAVAQQPLRQ